jgi:hypothetical protein
MRVANQIYLDHISKVAPPLTGARHDYDPLLKRIGNAKFVLIGEASHGTHEIAERRKVDVGENCPRSGCNTNTFSVALERCPHALLKWQHRKVTLHR